jgi:hypothetical protein
MVSDCYHPGENREMRCYYGRTERESPMETHQTQILTADSRVISAEMPQNERKKRQACQVRPVNCEGGEGFTEMKTNDVVGHWLCFGQIEEQVQVSRVCCPSPITTTITLLQEGNGG